jgi:sugar lactone lactonase YvrE
MKKNFAGFQADAGLDWFVQGFGMMESIQFVKGRSASWHLRKPMLSLPKSAFHSVAVHHHRCLRCCGAVFLALAWLALSVPQAQAQTTNYALGTTNLLVGPSGGSNSVVLAVTPQTGTWTATTNATWLHLSQANQSGTGSTNVVFSYDANPGATRSGTLTVAGLTLTVTQAGSTYVAANAAVTLVSAGLNEPANYNADQGLAVDGAGNLYICDTYHGAVKEWSAANNTLTTLVSLSPHSSLGVAVDGAGNVYFTSSSSVTEWTAANSNVITLVSSSSFDPQGVAVDGAGNVYIADPIYSTVKEWMVANSNVTTLGFSNLLDAPNAVAVDALGNVYIGDYGTNAIYEWTAANSNVVTLVSSNLFRPCGVAVDGGGNVYIDDSGHNAIKLWSAANHTLTTLVSTGLSTPKGVAVDGAGNVYILDNGLASVKELPNAFVDPTPKMESPAAGNDTLPAVLPATANLQGPFAPTSDRSWLTITGVTNSVLSFSFTANTGANRTAYITLLGQTIPVTQGGLSYSLGTGALLVGPSAGTNSVVLDVIPGGPWTATANATWLHLSPANQSGTGSTNVVFSYDANPGATRAGTLTIFGQTLTVTQAGSTYVAAGAVTTLVSAGLTDPFGVAVDGVGNVYFSDYAYLFIKEWMVANNSLTTLVSYPPSGFFSPYGVAVDGPGNVYFADAYNNAIKEWTAISNSVIPLVSSGLANPRGVALDGAGNVYFADLSHKVIKEWTAANSNVATLISSGLSSPVGVALDVAGNVYIADNGNNTVEEWMVATSNLTTLALSAFGLNNPNGVAVDGSGNVFIADTGNSRIREWTVANSNVTTIVSLGLANPEGVAVDGTGNIYIADTSDHAIKELPYAFVDPTPKSELAAAGNDALPQVLPATENLLPPFAPTSDQGWLTITGITNDVVSFSFTFNPSSSRTAHITLLGQSIPITQAGAGVTPPILAGPQMLEGGLVQFAFTNIPNASFTVLSTTNLSLPLSNWTAIGAVSNMGAGQFQFILQPASNGSQSFYTVRSP